MKAKNSEKQESIARKRIRLTTAARQACRKSELISNQAQLAKAQLKAARRNFKTLKKAAKKAGKKAARCQEELAGFLKSLKRAEKRKPAKVRAAPARPKPGKKTPGATVAAPAPPAAPAAAPVTISKPNPNPSGPLL